MQFVTNGPDVPNTLLKAHEEGNVVFFCGAGISYPAGLPGFKGLVESIYEISGTTFSEMENEAFKNKQYDITLDLLERRLPGKRSNIRKALAQTLNPKIELNGAIETHAALLSLARNNKEVLRLVTTNFDRIFHETANITGQSFKEYTAPLLPTPKKSRWDGLVYLHGLLQEKPSDDDLNNLVITSGDFGLAYLTERWASRFVSELFRHYNVCFVGYSINDPVMRYMMDALAADRRSGEFTNQAWVFDSYTSEQKQQKTLEWKTKGITPVLYHIDGNQDKHLNLHKTLHAWSEIYNNTTNGKENIIDKYASALPSESTPQDNFVSSVLWALSDPSGLPAEKFSNANPVPALEWLYIFSEERYGYSDLSQFGILPHDKIDKNIKFSLISRPASYAQPSKMQLAAIHFFPPPWDRNMSALANWLTRHLNDPRLIFWLIEKGGQLHEEWYNRIESRLFSLTQLENENKTSDLADICKHAPNAIPGPRMQTLWQLLLSGKIKSRYSRIKAYWWQKRLLRFGLTVSVRSEFREMLSPKVKIYKPLLSISSNQKPMSMQKLVHHKLEFNGFFDRTTFLDLSKSWNTEIFSDLLDDIQILLRDALDLNREMEESFLLGEPLPSISPHPQNRSSDEWVVLIELLRDSWLKKLELNADSASKIAKAWFELPYTTFKRLALFAANKEKTLISSEQWVKWLLADNAFCLWSERTKRETFRLLVTQGRKLTPNVQEKLEEAILLGPPQDWEASNKKDLIWIRLAKLNSSGLFLGVKGSERLVELSFLYPDLKLAKNERDEFSSWNIKSGDPDFEAMREIDRAPHTRGELVTWLRKPVPHPSIFYESTWSEVCLEHFPACYRALCDLSTEGVWPTIHWQAALEAWSTPKGIALSSPFIASLIEEMPDNIFLKNIMCISQWLQNSSQSSNQDEETTLQLCQRIITLLLEEAHKEKNDPHQQNAGYYTIENAIRDTTQAILYVFNKKNLPDGKLIPENIKSLLTQLASTPHPLFRHSRVILFSHLVRIFHIDQPWTKKNMLPLLSWDNNKKEAKVAWAGFLSSSCVDQPLLIAFKRIFLDSVHHYDDLADRRNIFVTLLTQAALNKIEGFTAEDFQNAIKSLPQEGLDHAAHAFAEAIFENSQNITSYWEKYAFPFWKNIWPKYRNIITPAVSNSLAEATIYAGKKFPDALNAMEDCINPVSNPSFIIDLMNDNKLCTEFPSESLKLLSLIIENQDLIITDLEACLKKARLPIHLSSIKIPSKYLKIMLEN